LPNGLALVRDPRDWAAGVPSYVKSFTDKAAKARMDKSGFLRERYELGKIRERFDPASPTKLAAWMLGAGDEIGTKLIWNMAYEQARRTGEANLTVRH
jgi:hypothetical protein